MATRAQQTGPDLFDVTNVDLPGSEPREAMAAEAQRVDRSELLRRHLELIAVDCCTGQPCPRGGGVGPVPEYEQVRCGRCGEFTFRYGMTINHDLGYVGCPADRQAREDAGAAPFFPHVDITEGRHDSQHHAPCGCGHPWGIHGGWDEPPETAHCLAYCGCQGYIPTRCETQTSRTSKGTTMGNDVMHQIQRDMIARADDDVTCALAAAGVNADRVTVDPDLTWHVALPGGYRAALGESTGGDVPADGADHGYDYSVYDDEGGMREQDWAPTLEGVAAALVRFGDDAPA